MKSLSVCGAVILGMLSLSCRQRWITSDVANAGGSSAVAQADLTQIPAKILSLAASYSVASGQEKIHFICLQGAQGSGKTFIVSYRPWQGGCATDNGITIRSESGNITEVSAIDI